MASTSLRRAHIEDIDLLVRLIGAYHAFEGIESNADDVRRVVAPLLDGDAVGHVYLIEHEARTVGYVALCFGYSIEFGGRDAFLDEVFLIESHRNRGIGRAALEQVADSAKGLGVRALHLEVRPDNTAARSLYEQIGFAPRDDYRLMTRKL